MLSPIHSLDAKKGSLNNIGMDVKWVVNHAQQKRPAINLMPASVLNVQVITSVLDKREDIVFA